MNSFSAKDLCMRSCMQIRMFMLHPEKRPQPTQNMLEGVAFQDNVCKSLKNVIDQEMVGEMYDGDDTIRFSIDIVTSDAFMEVKSVDKEREVPDWYRQSSLLQCAVYYALLQESDGGLHTAKFRCDQGFERISCQANKDNPYVLIFGDERYSISLLNKRAILDFIIEKKNACSSWDDAKAFDNQYKKKEFEVLSKYFQYEKNNKMIVKLFENNYIGKGGEE